MPQAKSKPPHKPVKYITYGYDSGVKECMCWPDPSAKTQSAPTGAAAHKLIPKKGEVGKPLNRGFDLSGFEHEMAKDPSEEDHAIDALRGWPYRSSGEIGQGENGDVYGLYERTTLEVQADERKQKKKSKTAKSKKSGSRRSGGLEGNDGPDPHMGDLISHRFMTEAARARREQNEKERRAEIQKRKLDYEKKFPKDIKATKASQLRSIAQAEKVGTDGRQLWQMSKFKDVPSALDTFRGSPRRRDDMGQNRLPEFAQAHYSYSPGKDEWPRSAGSKEGAVEPELTSTSELYGQGQFTETFPPAAEVAL